MNKKYPVPAIVIGGGITALGVIRCLSQYKISTYLVTDRKDYVRFSKRTIPLSYNLTQNTNELKLANLLENLKVKEAVLFPCSDIILEALINYPHKTKSHFYFSLPSKNVAKIMTRKDMFADVLKNLNIPHPQTFRIHSIEQIINLKDKIANNYFLKPCNSKVFSNHFHVKAFKLTNVKDAIDKFEMIQEVNESVVLQEYIPGSPDLHYFVDGFVDINGNIISLLARRRIRIYPPDFGNSSYCESVKLDEVNTAITSLRKLFNSLNYRGIFSAEFKYDERDGEFKILEINARPWWYVEFAAFCGINVCLQAYQDALNIPITQSSRYKSGRGCMHAYHDFLAIQNMKDGNLTTFSWIMKLIKSRGPFFLWDDPLPGMHQGVKFINHFKNKIYTCLDYKSK